MMVFIVSMAFMVFIIFPKSDRFKISCFNKNFLTFAKYYLRSFPCAALGGSSYLNGTSGVNIPFSVSSFTDSNLFSSRNGASRKLLSGFFCGVSVTGSVVGLAVNSGSSEVDSFIDLLFSLNTYRLY